MKTFVVTAPESLNTAGGTIPILLFLLAFCLFPKEFILKTVGQEKPNIIIQEFVDLFNEHQG